MNIFCLVTTKLHYLKRSHYIVSLTLLFTILLALLAHAAEYVSERAKGCLDAN